MQEIQETAKAIVKLDLWKQTAKYNWAFKSQLSVEPFIVAVNPLSEGAVVGRLLFFRGFDNFRDFCLLRRFPDYGVAMTPMDIPHEELVGLENGSAELVTYRPGYIPIPFDKELETLYGPVLRECGGLMMRLETEPELPASFAKEDSLFCRCEGWDGKWRDEPLKVPDMSNLVWTESVVIDKAKCDRASALPIDAKIIWEVDLLQALRVHTREKFPRFMYLLAAVDKTNSEKRLWERMSVGAGGLKAIWESAAGQVLDAILACGYIPGEIHVRTPRLMRFLRPLGMQLPFKLVQHSNLNVLGKVLSEDSILTGKIPKEKNES